MLNVGFKSGKKLNLLSALAVFTIVMGFLFLIAASPGAQTSAAILLMLFGAICLISNWMYVALHHTIH